MEGVEVYGSLAIRDQILENPTKCLPVEVEAISKLKFYLNRY